MQNKPPYGITSVDHALRLVLLLQQEGGLRLSDAAERLGVARSTAHRLLAMLVYRDFAEQDADRRYVPGPALRRSAAPQTIITLRSVALPHMEALSQRTRESVNLSVLADDRSRFIASVEARQVLRVGDREGKELPAHLTSGGCAVLATRSDAEVAALYETRTDVDVPALLEELRRVRKRGVALNDQRTEPGVTALGCAVREPDGRSRAAVSLAMPSVRFSADLFEERRGSLASTAKRIEEALGALSES
ncbi:IclR family transcriptional regulator [Streptomyces sp. NPDC055105]|uniref:IclR family transcriptional regulator n=1 Tax=Streptomyces sp. NPDC055105 TaxID=3365719 RepID=UPI0037CD0151